MFISEWLDKLVLYSGIRYALPAYSKTMEGSCALKIMPWNAISKLDMLSVDIVFGIVFVSAVNMIFISVSGVRVIPMLVIILCSLAVMVIPSVIMMPVSRVSIYSFMIPA